MVAGADGNFIRFRCQNLMTHDAIGKSGATSCAVHDKKYVGMPIIMIAENGRGFYQSRCVADYPREQDAIPPECSYQWDRNREDKPKWSLLYAPKI